MDCQVALNILDTMMPSEDPNAHPEFQDALAHRNGCETCMEIWNARHHFDLAVASTIKEVSVPGHLKETLLKNLNSPVQQAGNVSGKTRFNRSRLGYVLTALSLCLVCGLSLFFWNRTQTANPELQLVTIQAEVPASLNRLKNFDGSFPAPLPQKGWQDQAFTYTSQPKGVSSDGSRKHDRAIYGFELSLQNQPAVQGLLVVYSKDSVKNVPDRDSFDSSSVKYLNRDGSRFASVSWVSGDQVYVCYVYAGDVNDKNSNGLNAIESIERVVNLPTV